MALKITALLVLIGFVFGGNYAQDIIYSPISQYGHNNNNNNGAVNSNPIKSIPLLPYKQNNNNIHHNEKDHHHQDHHPVEYKFGYAVHDEHTKDIKGQEETRHGDVVKGRYEMIDSDGFKRIVEYTADDKNGFQAVVHREKTDIIVPIPEQKPHHKNDDHHNNGKYEHHHDKYEHHNTDDYVHNVPKYNNNNNNHFKHTEEPFGTPSIQNIQKRHTSLKDGYVAPIYEN